MCGMLAIHHVQLDGGSTGTGSYVKVRLSASGSSSSREHTIVSASPLMALPRHEGSIIQLSATLIHSEQSLWGHRGPRGASLITATISPLHRAGDITSCHASCGGLQTRRKRAGADCSPGHPGPSNNAERNIVYLVRSSYY
jgi:hypothetical protein